MRPSSSEFKSEEEETLSGLEEIEDRGTYERSVGRERVRFAGRSVAARPGDICTESPGSPRSMPSVVCEKDKRTKVPEGARTLGLSLFYVSCPLCAPPGCLLRRQSRSR